MANSNDAANDVGVYDHTGTVVNTTVETIHDVFEGKQSGYPALSISVLAEDYFAAVNCCYGYIGDPVCLWQSAIWQHGSQFI